MNADGLSHQGDADNIVVIVDRQGTDDRVGLSADGVDPLALGSPSMDGEGIEVDLLTLPVLCDHQDPLGVVNLQEASYLVFAYEADATHPA